MKQDELLYDARWSNDLTDDFICDFIEVHSQVFGPYLTLDEFIRKYIENIYGASVLVVVYHKQNPVAARAFWRNDYTEEPAYQPVDTCVISAYRRKGIFAKMTKVALSLLPDDAIVYNFPNCNSHIQYLKLGWVNHKTYYLRFLSSIRDYLKLHPQQPTERYLNWWIKGRKKLYTTPYKDRWLLLQKLNKPFCYKVLGVIDKKMFPCAFPAICFYESEKKNFYNKESTALHVIGRNVKKDIPIWKIDALE